MGFDREIQEITEIPEIKNLLGNATSPSSKFKTKNWVEINDDSCGTYNTNSQIKFKTLMLKSSLCDYSAFILETGAIAITGRGADQAARLADERNKGITF